MVQGCNLEAIATLVTVTSVPVIASDSTHNLGDIQTLLNSKVLGIIGAVTGRVIYEGTLGVADSPLLIG